MNKTKNKKEPSSHFTPEFRKILKEVERVSIEQGAQAARTLFRDKMLEIGHDGRIRNLYRINTKLNNKAEFFVPNAAQEKFLNTRKGRDIILKCRQTGFTTLSGIRGLDYALWEPNSKCGILAHLQITVTTIFTDIVKFSYNWFLRDWGSLYKPTEKSSSRTELAFTDDGLGRPLESSMRVLFDFRGKTINFLHVSEASRVEDDRLLGSLQGVPANGQVIYESTPQGRIGDYFAQWQNWRNLASLAPYKGHAIYWQDFYPEDSSQWQLPPGALLTPYERSLIEDYGLTEAAISWRRWCIAANCQGDEDRFNNEYPTDDINCFLTGEANVFPSSLLKLQMQNVRPPSAVGFLFSDGGAKLEFADDKKGIVAVWERPEIGASYVIGADPAGGIGRDRAAAYVKNQNSGKYVARLWGQLEPHDFANELYKLATWYNKAWICPEANNHGHLVIHVLSTKGYKNLYKRKVIDELTQKPTSKVGFQTSSDNKLTVTEKFKTALKNGQAFIHDNDLINEMTTFVQISSKTGRSVRREATAGAHDDLIMAACFTEEMSASRAFAVPTNEASTSALPGFLSQIDEDTGLAS